MRCHDKPPVLCAHALVTGWPSGAVLSAEAGAVFGALGMGTWTESTQGTRIYRPAPDAMPPVALFEARVRALLAQALPTDERSCLTPVVLDLSPVQDIGAVFHPEQ